MSAALPALATWVLTAAAGYGVLALAGARPRVLRPDGQRGLGGPEALGYALLAGAAVAALLVVVLSPVRQVSAWTVGGGLLLVAVIGLVRGRGAAEGDGPGSGEGEAPAGDALDGSTPKDWLAFLPALAVVALTVHLAALRPVWNVDAQRRWVLHAQWTAHYDTAVPEEVALPALATSHPSYPPLVSGLAAVALDLGADPDRGLRPLFPGFLLALVAIAFGFAHRRAGPRVAALVALALALTPALSHTDRLGLGAGAAHADVALAAYLTGVLALVLSGLDRGRAGEEPDGDAPNLGKLSIPGTWTLTAVLAVGAAWTKNEGLVYVALALVATAIGCLASPSLRRHGRTLALPTLAAIGAGLLWKLVARAMPVAEGEDYVSGGIVAVVLGGLERLPTILARLGAEFADLTLWGTLWCAALPLALVASLLPRPGASLARRAVPGLWLLLGLALVVAAYLATGWKGGRYEVLMDVSLARLIAHHAPLVALLIVEAWGAPRAPRQAGLGD